MKTVLNKSLINCNLTGTTKTEVFEEMADLFCRNGNVKDKAQFIKDLNEREATSNTELEDGVVMPHAKSASVDKISLAIGISKQGINYEGQNSELAKVFFMIAAPTNSTSEHIDVLSQVTSKLLDENVIDRLKKTKTSQEVMEILQDDEVEEKIVDSGRFLIGVTGCITGVAHTYLAAEALEKAAKENNCRIKVETNGSIGVKNSPTTREIEEAEVIIIASDKQIEMDRFHGKKVIRTGVKMGIKNNDSLIKSALAGEGTIHTASGNDEKSSASSSNIGGVYTYLMNGVSHMIPFVVVGGLMIAIALALGGDPTPGGLKIPDGSFWNQILNIGVAGFTLMIPILAGYIAYAIGDRAALAPGMIGGWIANNGSFYGASAGTGFIGAIVAGFLVGYFVKWMKSFNYHKMIQPLLPIMIIPITATLFIACMFIFVIGAPIASMMIALNDMLVSLSTGSLLLVGLVMGLMQGFDMGGPFGKVVLMFNIGLIAEGQGQFMGAQACAIPVAPLGMALAAFVNRKLFNKEEFENGKAALAMGLVGISEGAIPFAASDPLAVIPANMLGSAVACILAFTFGVSTNVAHGGPVLVFLGALNKPVMALIAMALGSIATAAIAIGIKTIRINLKAKKANRKKGMATS